MSAFEKWKLEMLVGGTRREKLAMIDELKVLVRKYASKGIVHNPSLGPHEPEIASGAKCPHCEAGIYRTYKRRAVGADVLLCYWRCELPGTRSKNPDCSGPRPKPTYVQRTPKFVPRGGTL